MAATALGLMLASGLMAADPPPQKAAIRSMAEAPEKFAGKFVVVEGTLVNEGKNYFTDLRVVIKEKSGEKIYVRPWLPLSFPPGPPGQKSKRPTLAQFLDKHVELKGTFDKGSVRGVGDTHVLAVKEARVLK